MDPYQSLRKGIVCLAVIGLIGCGGAEEAAPTADTGTQDTSGAAASKAEMKTAGVPASIPTPAGAGEDPGPGAASSEPEADEHESVSILKQIQQLRSSPITGDVEATRLARRERNEQIIDLATSVLRVTKDDPEHLAQFHQGIGQLLEARFQLALSGGQDDVEALYADVQALNDRDPESVAAAEGVYYLARFAHTRAGLVGKSNPVWFETFSRWAREFSDRFPNQSQRAVSLLFGAARSCELHSLATDDGELRRRLATEAQLCYSMLVERFPDSDQGQEAVAVLRRIAVVGKPLSQFSGPTIDGGFVSAENFTGKPTLIYFWDSRSNEFADTLLPLLVQLREQIPADRLRMVGVPLDEEEVEFDAFVESHQVPGQQIFFPDVNQRSWDSPLLRYWGVSRVPSVWVIDADRNVITTDADSRNLVATLKGVFQE